MTLKELLAKTEKTNKLLKEIGVKKEFAVYIKEQDWLWKKCIKEWVKDWIKEVRELMLNTEIKDDLIEFEYTLFKGWKDHEETKSYKFRVRVFEEE